MNIKSTIKSQLPLYFKAGYSYNENYVLDCIDTIYLTLRIYDEDGSIKTAFPNDVRSSGMTFLRSLFIDENGNKNIIYSIAKLSSPF
ncbi:hypothetical protein EZ449_21990 [Pedobacter frigidisoli]|uniref:Uncharacterized protein n=1 Tax=Pedobacter frigidisoli TaxID=2530455 RepID=A0A4R0NEB5_9SPHI|nr:hypothetical protein [Pedobacter frigidisoli]TCC97492.1 hypothetical protein EZ449_21990 [Pedobacter frigidisoli]